MGGEMVARCPRQGESAGSKHSGIPAVADPPLLRLGLLDQDDRRGSDLADPFHPARPGSNDAPQPGPVQAADGGDQSRKSVSSFPLIERYSSTSFRNDGSEAHSRVEKCTALSGAHFHRALQDAPNHLPSFRSHRGTAPLGRSLGFLMILAKDCQEGTFIDEIRKAT